MIRGRLHSHTFQAGAILQRRRILPDSIRIRHPPTGRRAQVQSKGAEVDLDYQPDKHFSITGNFTYLLANYHQVAPYEQTGNYLDAYPTN